MIKRILLTILSILFAVNVYAASVCSEAITFPGETIAIVWSCTGDATGAITDTPLTSSALTAVRGFYLYRVDIIGNHGGTEPTNDSDVYLYHKSGGVTKAVDLLDGNGINMLHNDTNTSAYAAIDGTAAPQPVYDTVTLDVDNNSVNANTYTITAVFVK